MSSGYSSPPSLFWRHIRTSPAFVPALFLSILGTIFATFFTYETLLRFWLKQRGISQQAVVVYLSRSAKGNATLHVAYTDHKGFQHQGWRRVRSSAYQRGQIVRIVFDPEKPSRFEVWDELDSPRAMREILIMGLIGVFLATIGYGLLAKLGIRGRLKSRLFSEGTLAEGRVVDVLKRNYSVGNRQPTYLRYEFTGNDGIRRTGESDTLSLANENKFKPGDSINVLFDPNSPERNVPDTDNAIIR